MTGMRRRCRYVATGDNIDNLWVKDDRGWYAPHMPGAAWTDLPGGRARIVVEGDVVAESGDFVAVITDDGHPAAFRTSWCEITTKDGS